MGLRFQPTPPVGGHNLMTLIMSPLNYFNPRPPCGGDLIPQPVVILLPISIHAPREGRPSTVIGIGACCYFNPRPCVWGDLLSMMLNTISCIFQPTPPVWGATDDHLIILVIADISTHAPCVGATRGTGP